LRLLHTADWHIGRTLMNQSRRADIESSVNEVINIARLFKPDLILHAGDLFDSVRPPYEEIRWAFDRLKELAGIAPTVVLAGNHDSTALFTLFNSVLAFERDGSKAPPRLQFVPYVRPPQQGGILEFEAKGGGIVKLAPLPFIHQNKVVNFLEDPKTWNLSYADQIALLMEGLGAGLLESYDVKRDVLLFAAHLHVAGARVSGSERSLYVSDVYATRPEAGPTVSYAAYGHLHRPQDLPGLRTGCYSGSIFPVDLGEMDEQKEVVLVEALPGRAARIEHEKVSGERILRRLVGTMEELEKQAPDVRNALCHVMVHTDVPTPDISQRVIALFPEATILDINDICSATTVMVITEASGAGERELSFAELFGQFLTRSKVKAGSSQRILGTVTSVLQAVEDEHAASDEELDQIEGALMKEGAGEAK